MTDHPVLIPTPEGPVGGIVSEPTGERRAALILLGGYGRGARSGINSPWTRMARALAEMGVVVLRADYSGEGETLPIREAEPVLGRKIALDLRLLKLASAWFKERIGGLPVLLSGVCAGARFAILLAGHDPDMFAGAFLVVPNVKNPKDSVDPEIVESLRASLALAPSWILVGAHDTVDVPLLKRRVGPTLHDLKVEAVPGMALHVLAEPDQQSAVSAWLQAHISRLLEEFAQGRSGVPTAESRV